jgi:uncharacterized protein (DUF1330 family)
METPVYLLVQGKLKDGAEELYEQYVRGVLPLLKEFGVESVAIGAGFENEFTNTNFPINILMKLPSEEVLNNFLGDARYLEIKRKYRDKAYEKLNMSVFHGRAPRTLD